MTAPNDQMTQEEILALAHEDLGAALANPNAWESTMNALLYRVRKNFDDRCDEAPLAAAQEVARSLSIVDRNPALSLYWLEGPPAHDNDLMNNYWYLWERALLAEIDGRYWDASVPLRRMFVLDVIRGIVNDETVRRTSAWSDFVAESFQELEDLYREGTPSFLATGQLLAKLGSRGLSPYLQLMLKYGIHLLEQEQRDATFSNLDNYLTYGLICLESKWGLSADDNLGWPCYEKRVGVLRQWRDHLCALTEALTRVGAVGAVIRSQEEIIADPQASEEEILTLLPSNQIEHPNCPSELWWLLAEELPVEAISSVAYPLFTLEQPERWKTLERKNLEEWIELTVHDIQWTDQRWQWSDDCVWHFYESCKGGCPDLTPDLLRRVLRERQAYWQRRREEVTTEATETTWWDCRQALTNALPGERWALDWGAALTTPDLTQCARLTVRAYGKWEIRHIPEENVQQRRSEGKIAFEKMRKWQWHRAIQYVRGEA